MDSVINNILFLYILSLYIFTFTPGLNLVSNAIGGIFILLVGIKMYLQKKRIIFDWFLFLYLLFILVCVISCFIALEPFTSTDRVKTLLLYFILIGTLINYVDSYDKLEKLITYFIYSGVISSIIILFGSDLSQMHILGKILGNKNMMSIITGMTAVFSFYFVLYKEKYIYIFPAIVTLIMVLLIRSRTSLVFVLVNIFLLICFMDRIDFRKRIKYIILFILILFLFYYLALNVPILYEIVGERWERVIHFFYGIETSEKSISLRAQMIEFGFKMFKEKPIFGYGINNYKVLFKNAFGIRKYSHNNYIELLVGVGIVGLISYYLMYFKIMFELIKVKSKSLKNYRYLFLSLLISILIIGYSNVYYFKKHFYIILAMSSILINIYKKKYNSHLEN